MVIYEISALITGINDSLHVEFIYFILYIYCTILQYLLYFWSNAALMCRRDFFQKHYSKLLTISVHWLIQCILFYLRLTVTGADQNQCEFLWDELDEWVILHVLSAACCCSWLWWILWRWCCCLIDSDGKAAAGFSDLTDTSSSPSVLRSSAVTERFQTLVTESMTNISVHDKEKKESFTNTSFQVPCTLNMVKKNFFIFFLIKMNKHILIIWHHINL